MATTVFKSTSVSSASGLTRLRRDMALLNGNLASGGLVGPDNGGVKFAFDLAFPYSWPSSAAPSAGAAIMDTSETGNGSWTAVGTGETYAGGGFDLTGLTGGVAYVAAPSTALASIWAGNQYFLGCGWFKLPSSGAWNSTGNAMVIMTAAASTYTAGADLFTVDQTLTPRLNFRRQTNGGSTVDTRVATPDANIFGQVCQIGVWRNSGGQGLRIKSALGQVLVTTATVGSANTGNFSAGIMKWGAPPTFVSSFANNIRVYRGWIEDLQVSGRDPTAVLDLDFTTTISRAVFS